MPITGNFKHFQYFNNEINFLRNGNLFQKAGEPFLVESSKIENVIFAYKTSQLEVSAKTNRKWGVQNGPISKNKNLPVTNSYF